MNEIEVLQNKINELESENGQLKGKCEALEEIEIDNKAISDLNLYALGCLIGIILIYPEILNTKEWYYALLKCVVIPIIACIAPAISILSETLYEKYMTVNHCKSNLKTVKIMTNIIYIFMPIILIAVGLLMSYLFGWNVGFIN